MSPDKPLDLLPCPFCGSKKVQLDALMIGEAGKDNATPHGWHVECTECDASGPWRDTEAEAAQGWNRRPLPQEARPALAVSNFRCSEHGPQIPVPACPKCIEAPEQQDPTPGSPDGGAA